MATTTGERSSVRARLLEAADELFYREGVQSVGIDRVIEHAGVAKASLYKHFGSKEELVHAYLLERHERIRRRLTAAVEEHQDPRSRMLAVFESQGATMRRPGFRGCAFAGASAEAPAGGLVEQATRDYRDWVRELFVRLATDGAAHDPQALAVQLHLLYDGAAAAGNLDHDGNAADTAAIAAAALWDTATG